MNHKAEVLFSYGHCKTIQIIWNTLVQLPFFLESAWSRASQTPTLSSGCCCSSAEEKVVLYRSKWLFSFKGTSGLQGQLKSWIRYPKALSHLVLNISKGAGSTISQSISLQGLAALMVNEVGAITWSANAPSRRELLCLFPTKSCFHTASCLQMKCNCFSSRDLQVNSTEVVGSPASHGLSLWRFSGVQNINWVCKACFQWSLSSVGL